MTALHLRVAARTHTGRCRDVNEDAFTITELSPRDLVVGIYDGCGGASPTEGPSITAAQTVDDEVRRWSRPPAPGDLAARVDAALTSACAAVWRTMKEKNGDFGMGTTAMICGVVDGRLAGVHVGDARAYHCREGALVQLSRDDTLLQDLLDRGAITPADADEFVHGTVITRVLGLGPEIDRSAFSVRLVAHDRVVLVTDGIWRQLAPTAFRDLVAASGNPRSICDALVEAAEAAGGHDNETAIVIDCAPAA